MARLDLLSWIMFVSKVGGGLVGVLCIILYIFQNNLMYVPRPPGFPITPEDNPEGCKSPAEWTVKATLSNGPNDLNRIPFEDVVVKTTDNESIHTWLLLQKNSNQVPTLIYFHGNAGNMGFRLQNAAEMYYKTGINVLMMDYRGYGKSTGKPTEKGLELDAEAVLQHVLNHPKLKGSLIVLFGRSLGGAVAVSLAKRRADVVGALVLENTFTSIPAMVDLLMPYLRHFKALVLRINWNSLQIIGDLTQPILFISGDSDELVPPFHMKQLHDRATLSRLRDFFSVSGGAHSDTWVRAGTAYYKRLKSFLAHVSPSVTEGENIGEDTEDTRRVTENCRETGQGHHAFTLPSMGTDFAVK